MTKKTKILIAWIVAAVIAAAVLSVGPGEEQADQDQYCEMVALNKQDPSVGWPDYNHNYEEVCANAR